jgi:hypothetical protein
MPEADSYQPDPLPVSPATEQTVSKSPLQIIRDYKPFFDPDTKDLLARSSLEENLQYLEPDMTILKAENLRSLGSGTGFEVYACEINQEPRVIKVEKIAIETDSETGVKIPLYPWRKLSIGTDRPELHSPVDAITRKQIHLDVQARLQAVGINTADYIGSVMLPAMHTEDSNTPLPMYAEIWDKPDGELLEANEDTVNRLYKTPEGRQVMKDIATKILTLSQQGYLYDVTQEEKLGYHTKSTSPKTEAGNPYPRNFIVSDDDEIRLTAIDLNLGIDLSVQSWWPPSISDIPVMARSINGALYPNWVLKEQLDKHIDKIMPHISIMAIDVLTDKSDIESQKQIETDRFTANSAIDRFTGQIEVATAILNKIEEIESTDKT